MTAAAAILLLAALWLAVWSYLLYPPWIRRLARRGPPPPGPAAAGASAVRRGARRGGRRRARDRSARRGPESAGVRRALRDRRRMRRMRATAPPARRGGHSAAPGASSSTRSAGARPRCSTTLSRRRRPTFSSSRTPTRASTRTPCAGSRKFSPIRPWARRAGGCRSSLGRKAVSGDGSSGTGRPRRSSRKGRLGVCLGANGAIYAARRRAVVPLPPGTILDDFLIPARVARGRRVVVFAADAVARETLARDARVTRCRAVSASARAPGRFCRRERWLWDFRNRPLLALVFLSRKAARWLAPVAALLAAVAALGSRALAAYAAGALAVAAALVLSRARIRGARPPGQALLFRRDQPRPLGRSSGRPPRLPAAGLEAGLPADLSARGHSAFRPVAVAGDVAVCAVALCLSFRLRTRVSIPGTETLLPLEKVRFTLGNLVLFVAAQGISLSLFGLYGARERFRDPLARLLVPAVSSPARDPLRRSTSSRSRRPTRSRARSSSSTSLLDLALLAPWRAALDRLFPQPRRRAAIVGAGPAAALIADAIRRHPGRASRSWARSDRPATRRGLAHLGEIEALAEIAARDRIDDLILTPEAPSWRDRLAGAAARPAIRDLLVWPSPFETMIGRLRFRIVGDLPLLEAKVRPLEGLGAAVKRAFDVRPRPCCCSFPSRRARPSPRSSSR